MNVEDMGRYLAGEWQAVAGRPASFEPSYYGTERTVVWEGGGLTRFPPAMPNERSRQGCWFPRRLPYYFITLKLAYPCQRVRST